MDGQNVNRFIHKYVIAAAHAILWLAALSLAAYFHLDHGYSAAEALLGSTLMAYCAYVCESGLGTWRVAALPVMLGLISGRLDCGDGLS